MNVRFCSSFLGYTENKRFLFTTAVVCAADPSAVFPSHTHWRVAVLTGNYKLTPPPVVAEFVKT